MFFIIIIVIEKVFRVILLPEKSNHIIINYWQANSLNQLTKFNEVCDVPVVLKSCLRQHDSETTHKDKIENNTSQRQWK